MQYNSCLTSALLSSALHPFIRCPLTADGDGGVSNGSDTAGYKFQNNPDALFARYGYTEYLELEYATEVYGVCTHILYQ